MPALPPLVVAVRMGLGHLRAALPIAEAAGTTVTRADLAPVASPAEARLWATATEAYEGLSRRAADGGLARTALDAMTAIPAPGTPHPHPDRVTRLLDAAVRAGLGQGLVAAAAGRPVISTFYAQALAADRAGLPAVCVVTDTDCARAWVPPDPVGGALRYAAPTEGVVTRLRDYGVPADRIHLTGFPLPGVLVDHADADTQARIARLREGAPVRLVAAIGGAGAQLGALHALVTAGREALEGGRARLDVFVGLREDLAATLASTWDDLPGVLVHGASTFEAHAAAFSVALREADALWTKPSELAFYAALGLPLLATAPLGVQEERNMALLRERGLAMDAPVDAFALLGSRREELAAMAGRNLGALRLDGHREVLALAASLTGVGPAGG